MKKSCFGARPSCVLAALSMLAAGPASAGKIDLDSREFGENVSGQILSGAARVTAVSGDAPTTDNVGTPLTLTVLNTNFPTHNETNYPGSQTGNDYDLSRINTGDGAPNAGWEGGNIPANEDLGNVLIIQGNTTDDYTNPSLPATAGDWGASGNPDGRFDVPDDAVPGGGTFFSFRYDFLGVDLTSITFDVLDLEPASACCIELFDGSFDQADRVAQVFFNDFIDNTSVFFDPNVVYVNNGANRLTISSSQIGGAVFDRVQFNVQTSAAFGDISYTTVPEPSTLAVLGLGLVPLLALRRRHRS